MIRPIRLMRGVFVALAILGAAPLAGVPVLGAQAVVAQERLVASVLFEGNKRFSDANLFAMVDLGASGVFSQQRLAGDVETIRQAYVTDGFNGVSVTARTEVVDSGRVRVTFVIDEGQRAGIAAINFTGNTAFNSGTLKGVILTKETGFLSWLFRDDAYDDLKIAADRELIRLYYANRGYPDTQVTSVGEYDASRNAYFINYTIIEGNRYTFSSVGIETSIPGLNTDVLRNVVATGEGRQYSLMDLERTARDMAFEATAQGYAFADVRPRLERDLTSNSFRVTYLVDEGARVYVERINITGNTKTRDFVIRRELGFGEGDPFNRSMVIRGRDSIMALGFFSGVNVTSAQGSGADQIVINIAVVEQATGDYGASLGYSTTEGVLGELSLTERNFLGRGQYLRAAIGASEQGRTFDFSFTEPRFMGLRVSAGIDLYHRITNESAFSFYGYESTGGQVRLGMPITGALSISGFAGIDRKLVSDADQDLSNPDADPARASQLVVDGMEYWKAFVGYSLTYNTLDNTQNPTEGLFASFSQQYIGWDFNLLKTEARARYFMPLLDTGIVASVRGQAGIIHDLGGNGVHPLEAFNLGPQLVRGFSGRGFGPRLDANGEYLGATLYAGLSGEIQFPVPVLPESYGLSGAVWADAAWVGDAGTEFGAIDPDSIDNPLRASVGASIIWDSPFGPLRGDFAHILSQSTADRTQMFQLTLQTLF